MATLALADDVAAELKLKESLMREKAELLERKAQLQTQITQLEKAVANTEAYNERIDTMIPTFEEAIAHFKEEESACNSKTRDLAEATTWLEECSAQLQERIQAANANPSKPPQDMMQLAKTCKQLRNSVKHMRVDSSVAAGAVIVFSKCLDNFATQLKAEASNSGKTSSYDIEMHNNKIAPTSSTKTKVVYDKSIKEIKEELGRHFANNVSDDTLPTFDYQSFTKAWDTVVDSVVLNMRVVEVSAVTEDGHEDNQIEGGDEGDEGASSN